MRVSSAGSDYQSDPDPDPRGSDWVRRLRCCGDEREIASAELRELLVRVARPEARRRSDAFRVYGPEVDDLADQAATDALISILGKLDDFRGESKFTTWASKFVIFEVAGKVNRHFWRRGAIALDGEEWNQLPARFGMGPDHEAEWHDLIAALRTAVDRDLTDRQRTVFLAVVVRGVPLDALSAEMNTNRNAIYKVLFDARRKLREVLEDGGHIEIRAVSDRTTGQSQ